MYVRIPQKLQLFSKLASAPMPAIPEPWVHAAVRPAHRATRTHAPHPLPPLATHLQQPREPCAQRGGLPAALEPGSGDARHEEGVQGLYEVATQGDGAWEGGGAQGGGPEAMGGRAGVFRGAATVAFVDCWQVYGKGQAK